MVENTEPIVLFWSLSLGPETLNIQVGLQRAGCLDCTAEGIPRSLNGGLGQFCRNKLPLATEQNDRTRMPVTVSLL